MNATVSGLLEAIEGVLPAINQQHAAVVLAATLRQLTAGIDFEAMVVDGGDDAPAPEPTREWSLDEFDGLD